MQVRRACVVGRAVEGALDAVAAGQRPDLRHVVGPGREHVVEEGERARELEPLGEDVDADEARGAHRLREHGGREADRAEAGDEHGVVAADADPLEALVDRAEAAGDLGAVGVGERVGQQRRGPSPRRGCRAPCRRGAASRRPGARGWCRRSCSRGGSRCTGRSRRCGRRRRGRPPRTGGSRGRSRRSARRARAPRSSPAGSPPAPCRGAGGRCSGCRSRRSWCSSSAPAPRRGPAWGRRTSAAPPCCCPAGRRLPSAWVSGPWTLPVRALPGSTRGWRI